MRNGRDDMQPHYDRVAAVLGISAESVKKYRNEFHNAVTENRQAVRDGEIPFPEQFTAEARLAAMLVFFFHQPGKVSPASRGNIYDLMNMAGLDDEKRANVIRAVGPDPGFRPSRNDGGSHSRSGVSGAYRAVHA